MIRRIAILACLALVAATGTVHAKIPCLGDRLVKVLDVPALKGKGPDKADVSLGYKFPGCFGEGEWIGYLDSKHYVALDEAKTKSILAAAGLKQLPPEPSRFEYPMDALLYEILLVVVLIGLGAWSLLKPYVKRLRGAT